MNNHRRSKYYAVRIGRQGPRIYDNYPEVSGLPPRPHPLSRVANLWPFQFALAVGIILSAVQLTRLKLRHSDPRTQRVQRQRI